MKIILVSGFDPTIQRASGIRSYVLSLARQLVSLNQDVTILGLGSEMRRTNGIDFVPVARRVGNSALFVLALGRFLMRERGLDGIVHAQRPDELVPFNLQARSLPKVVTLHGVHGVHVAARRGRIAASIYCLAERYSLAHTDSILCVSSDTFNHFSSCYPKIARSLVNIPAGVDLDMFRPCDKSKAREKIGVPVDGKLVLFVGRFEPEKDPLAVLDCCLGIQQRHENVNLVMIGNGQLASALRVRAASAQGRVRISDPVPQEGLARLLCASDVLVIASRHEGLPTVALETLACGTPVVGTRVGILPEVIREGENGCLMESTNDLGQHIEKALYHIDWNPEKCRESVRDYGWDKVAQTILGIYRKVADAQGGST